MTWYFWVWGVISTLGGLLLIIVSGLGIWYIWSQRRWKEREHTLVKEAEYWEGRAQAEEARVSKLVRQLQESRRAHNHFGCISP